MTQSVLAIAIVFLLLPAAAGSVQPPPEALPAPPDYRAGESWLCRPGRADACAIDLTTTVVAAGGATTRETWRPAPAPAIDCFYVYPTVSRDEPVLSDLVPGDEERNVIRQQFARFASVCRPFAPMYRQVTLAGLRQRLTGGAFGLGRGVPYEDVRQAWRQYLAADNGGRGVVLIGHSQGAMVLTELIRDEIDGQAVQSRLVSAVLLGTSLAVPAGKDLGGAFKRIPLCRAPDQVGCAISYAAYRATAPPPANTLFGRVEGDGMEAACTNPAALGGGSGPLHAYLTGAGSLIAQSVPQSHQWASGVVVDTPFVSVPGLLSARCARNEHGQYLEIRVHADPSDARTDDIPGDLGAPGRVLANWGLHLVDVNLAMGNLVDIVGRQARAYVAR